MAKGVDPTLIGRTVAGKFTIESYIGGGAMGAVYKAKQLALDKHVALKVLHKELETDETFTSRFKREARAASRLDHPNSMRVIDFGVEPDGLLYIAMELLDGRDLLRVIVEDWPVSGPRTAGILMQALAALAVAHDQGIVHRDLKPENIMILRGTNDEGQVIDVVKVCDFGIAKLSDRSAKSSHAGPQTGQGLVVGTPEYMSPEQGKGETIDSRSDIYSIGVILYQMLTGRVPFEAESALGIVLKHVTEEPLRPSALNPLVDPRLETVCLKALSKRKEDRYQTAREMRAELRAVMAGSVTYIPSTPSLEGAPEDTAPLPLLPTASRSGPNLPPSPASSASAFSAPRTLPGAPPGLDTLPKTTSSTAAYSDERERPARAPAPALVGFAIVALVAVLAAAFVIHRSQASSTTTIDVAPQPAFAATSDSAPASPPAESARAEGAGAEATGDAGASGAPETPHPKSAGGAAHGKKPPESSTQPPTPAPAAAGPTSFNADTATTSASVTSAVGVSPGDVKKALPAGRFTQCYRDGLRRVAHRLAGKMSVHIAMGADGRVNSALVSAPESLVQGLGSCITEAFNQLPVREVSPAGGEADIAIVFTPE